MKRIIKVSVIAASMMFTGLVASDILATVNGKNITKQDAQMFVQATAPGTNLAQLTLEQQKMIADRLVDRELFTEAARKEGIEKIPEFEENLNKLKSELLVSLWMKAQMDNAIVSDSEAKEFYETNKEKFKTPESIKARHILVETEAEAQTVIDSLKKLEGEALQTEFIVLAKSKSTDSREKGGELPPFGKGQMIPEFEEAAFKLKDGEITVTPVKTKHGYHVILLEEKKPEAIVPYADVKERIIQTLKQKQFQVKLSEVAKEMKAKANIVFSDSFKALEAK